MIMKNTSITDVPMSNLPIHPHSTANIASARAPRKARSISKPSRVAANTACAAASLST